MIGSRRLRGFPFSTPAALWVAFLSAAACPLASPRCAAAEPVERVIMEREGGRSEIAGRVLVEARDGGLLLLAGDGTLWALQPEEIVRREGEAGEFRPHTQDQAAARVMAELSSLGLDGFRVHRTRNYVFVYNTSREYVQWVGGLFERLNRGFEGFWKHQGWELREPETPLIALVFDSKTSYSRYARTELGDAVDSIIGYYSLRTNRVLMYDLAGGGSAARIRDFLSQPDSSRNVATIIHEATHQLAFNRGLHQRYADIPLWVSEGIAVYFETPDLQSRTGWRTIGGENPARRRRFAAYLRTRPADSLRSLVAADDRFRDPAAAEDAYAEAWALNTYLFTRQREKYLEYLRTLAARKPLHFDSAEDRLAAFEAAFGPLAELEAAFLQTQRSP